MLIFEYFKSFAPAVPLNYAEGDAAQNYAETPEEPTVFYQAARWVLLALAFLTPVWFLPTTILPVIYNKAFMVGLLTIAAFALYLVHAVISGRFTTFRHWTLYAGMLALASWAVSAVLSETPLLGLLGTGGETTTFFAALIFLALAWLISSLFADAASLARFFIALIAGFALAFLFVILSFFGAFEGLGGIFASRTLNTIGSWNSVALAGGFLVLLLYPFLLVSYGMWRWVSYALFAAALLVMLLVNFSLAWWLLGALGLVVLSYSVWKKEVNGAALLGLIFILAFAILGIAGERSLADLVFAWGVQTPIEVGVSHGSTFSVLRQALSGSAIFGEGPATFGYLWDMHRPTEVNQTPFWGVRFASGSSYLFGLLAEIGILGWALLVSLLLGAWFLSLRAATATTSSEAGALALSPFLIISYMILVYALYPAGFTLATLGAISLGAALASVRLFGFIGARQVVIFGEGVKGFASALLVVLFIIGSVAGVYMVGTRYIGQAAYAQGIELFNVGGDLNEVERKIRLASSMDGRNDVYLRSLSQVYLTRAGIVLQDGASPRDLLTSQFKDALDASLSFAQRATEVSPMDFINYRALGKVYEFLVPLGTTGAAEAAIVQYDNALQRAPSNPALYRDKALVYLGQFSADRVAGNLENAEEALLKSVELKSDYAAGHFLLAQIYGLQGRESQAMSRAESAALIAPNDIGALFQLGILYYRANRLADAEAVFFRAVSINENYSNARYFLGLIYDRTGRKAEAEEQFSRVQSLNPGNDEVQRILVNLNEGKSALEGIAPPAPAPERREEPPVSE